MRQYKDGYLVPMNHAGTPSDKWSDYELYDAASRAADEMHSENDGAGREFWVARYAARATACALLGVAREVGVTDQQWEAMRKCAARVATD